MNSFTRLGSLIIFIFLSLCLNMASAQDMTNIKVDELTDTQINQFLRQVESSGLTDAQLEQVAISRGMPSNEVQKLRTRVDELKKTGERSEKDTLINNRQTFQNRLPQDSLSVFNQKTQTQIRTEAEIALDELKSKIFGASLFKNANPQFEPNLNIATPRNYIIGTGDELMIEIYGYSEASHQLVVSPEGNINIPYVGVVSVAGATIEQASTRIKSRLGGAYSGISSGNTNVSITISNIRSIKVIVTGEIVQPGTYTLPSVGTVFNALYSSGGPTENGSMRNIRVIRNGEVISVLDVYDFLTDGSLRNNITLQDQDVIHVPPYIKRVELIGEVKRPALFETKVGERFQELLDFAGGFTEYAYQDRIQVLRNTGKERRIEDLLASQFSQYEPQSGDKFTISRILDRFVNRVSISGAVFRPGDYELSPGLTLSMLIKKADGVTENAFLNLGTITRSKADLQPEQVSFNVANILAGIDPDIELRRDDNVVISSINDLQGEYTVTIDGEVRLPGIYSYAEGRTVRDLILEAGGFNEGATPLRVEVSRRVDNVDLRSEGSASAEIFRVDVDTDFQGEGGNFLLRPYDMVFVRTAPGYETQKTVRIEGEVLYPGSYTIRKKDERITDLIERAGGFTSFAYINGASLKRPGNSALREGATRNDRVRAEIETQAEKANIAMITSLQKDQENLSLTKNQIQQKIQNDYVGVDFERIVERPDDKANLILQDGDVIFIPKELQTVNVGGEVLSPVTAVYIPNKSLKYYISQGGGFSEQALKKRTYLVYANGSAKSTSSFLGIRSYPKVEPGAAIYVPKKQFRERQTISPQAWVGIGSTIASMAAIIFSMINNN